MTPERVSKGGTYRIQMTIQGVGRIAISSGARTITEYRKRRSCLEKLRDTGRLDILRAIKARQITVNEVYAADMAGRLGFVLADIVLHRTIRDAVPGWLETSAKAEATRRRYRVAWGVLTRSRRLAADATLRDLDAIDWQGWSNTWTASAAHWNHLRRMISKLLSDHIGKFHPFRRQVLDVFPRKKERPRRPDLSVQDFWKVANTIPEEMRAVYVTLVATLMRINEFLTCTDLHLLPHSRKIRVPGTKTVSSADDIPVCEELWHYVRAAIPCTFSHQQLWRRWRNACTEVGIAPTTLHDLRHVGAQWLSQSGRPEASIQAMLRHDDPKQTRRYTMAVLKQEDAEAMGRILAKGA